CRYISWVLSPMGSTNSWCLSLSANLTTLSSMDGQYLGPMPSIMPPYSGERWRLFLIISWVLLLVYVSQQLTCCLSVHSFSNENGIITSSPGCGCIFVKSMVLLFSLAGVPVLNLMSLMPFSLRLSESLSAGKNPSGPLLKLTSPMNIFPCSYVPVVSITALHGYTSTGWAFPAGT